MIYKEKKKERKKPLTKQKGASLRITPIWLFYPLAQQRTKCIDGSAMAPPVSGMFFTHQSAERSTVHHGHQANEVTFLLIGEKLGAFYLVKERQDPRQEEETSQRAGVYVGEGGGGSRLFHLHVADTCGEKSQ